MGASAFCTQKDCHLVPGFAAQGLHYSSTFGEEVPALATALTLTPAGLAKDVCSLDMAAIACCSGQGYRDGV